MGAVEPRTNLDLRGLLDRALDVVYPRQCLCCPQAVVSTTFCREHALPDLPRPPRCGHCAAPLPRALPDGERCVACRRGVKGLPRVVALGDYGRDQGLREVVLALKHRRRPDLAVPLGRALARRMERVLAERGTGSGRGVLVPIPLHPWRRFERGCDQAALLAESMGAELGWELARLVRRSEPTLPQGSAGVRSRRANVAGAFRLSERARRRAGGPRPVWLVDDVLTSGSTVRAVARILRGGGFEVDGVAVLARAASVRSPGDVGATISDPRSD